MTAGKTADDFEADRILRYAVERSIEVISEASRRIPDDLKATQDQIDWPAIAGIGNVMRHESTRRRRKSSGTSCRCTLHPFGRQFRPSRLLAQTQTPKALAPANPASGR
ncbi:HepT-like ribonuclease domain-containing protein [Xanthobacter wiegelii]|uniref:HepT-like ribonuclease domain-containing protein n=1 Tax=Xanthobacter wiegelii TaxID=3119913 RepID=UPI0037268E65